MGWDCVDIDIVNADPAPGAPEQDLKKLSLWDEVSADLADGLYDAIVMGTPCETASRARTGPPGPRPLRSASHIYGLPRDQLTEAEHEQVKWGTFFALKSAELARQASALQVP